MHSRLRVVQISFFRDPEERSPSRLLKAWPSLVDVAEAACAGGVLVSVVQASAHSDCLVRGGVRCHFLPLDEPEQRGTPSKRLAQLLTHLAPDVFHVHGLGFARNALSLCSLAPGVPIIFQDHADRLPRFWRRGLWRRDMAIAAGIAFCSRTQAQPFADAGLLATHTRIYEIPESSSRFVPGEPREARGLTGLSGSPALLWVGHLDDNKDPLTVLEGVSLAAKALPGLELWCCFGAAPRLLDVQKRIAEDSHLRGRVRLLGRVSHETIERLMRAADLFVLGSHREGSGYSVIEALACGLPPFITDIPSFRALTGAGAVGALWPCGDSQALCEALISARFDAATRAAVRAHFDRELSLPSLGGKLAAMYADAHERHRHPHRRLSAMGGS